MPGERRKRESIKTKLTFTGGLAIDLRSGATPLTLYFLLRELCGADRPFNGLNAEAAEKVFEAQKACLQVAMGYFVESSEPTERKIRKLESVVDSLVISAFWLLHGGLDYQLLASVSLVSASNKPNTFVVMPTSWEALAVLDFLSRRITCVTVGDYTLDLGGVPATEEREANAAHGKS